MDLTKTQQLIVEAEGKNVLVSAGAGTGKTRVLVERFLHLVTTGRALVTEILAVTFTEKAAVEMKLRIQNGFKKLGREQACRDLESAYISTIHAFASRVLKEHPIEAVIDPDFSVLEEEEADLLREEALDQVIESGCTKADGTFELLRIYGEGRVREGVLKVFNAARVEGRTVGEFFSPSLSFPLHPAGGGLGWGKRGLTPSDFDRVGEPQLAKEFNRFASLKSWSWDTVSEFQSWSAHFSKRGGKNNRAVWKENAGKAHLFLAAKMEGLGLPWKEKFEALALSFESLYESAKREKGVLDFDDLQRKVIDVFRGRGIAGGKLLEHYKRHFKFILVDEFQDTNPLQAELMQLLSSGGNLFFVGDFKQSIYGFRGTSPEHFLEKERQYEKGKEGVRVPLVENFRTAEPVLDFINRFFKNLWAEDGLPFEDLIATPTLTLPLQDEGGGEGRGSVEILVTEPREEESLDHARMREAALIAERIQELAEKGTPYGDIALLFQAMTSSGIYEQALKDAGIPYFVVAGRGFYHQSEIRDMMSFLASLENPLADIPLAAALRSPLFQVRDDTLFWLAHCAKEKNERTPLYEGVRAFEKISEIPESEKEKLRYFEAVRNECLGQKDRLRLTELLDLILEKTSYELTVLADPQGVRKYANLRKLTDVAREYESHSPLSLGEFIRVIRSLETREVRESEAQIEAEESGHVLRLMTIHAAKGLEFPIVFVADLARQKQSIESKDFLAEAGIGWGFLVRNEKTLEMEETLSWIRVEGEKEKRQREEWKRLFYVAATRAKSQLLLSGVWKEKKGTKDSFLEMSSWMDWVMSSHESFPEGVKVRHAGTSFPRREPLTLARKKIFQNAFPDFEPRPMKSIPEAEEILSRIKPREKPSTRVIDLPVSAYSAFRKDPKEYWRVYEIGYPPLTLPSPQRGEGWGEGEIQEPQEIEDDETSPADFGTAVHRILEYLDFKRPAEHLKKRVEEVFSARGGPASGGRGWEESAQSEALEILKKFTASPLFQSFQKAKRIYRELPFVLNERHGKIQGVIDVLFQDAAGAWHIVDYKTAVGDPEKVKQSGYDLQLQIYALAAWEIAKITPQSGVLYFLKNQWEHRMEFSKLKLEEFSKGLREMQEAIINFNQAAMNS